MDYVITAKAPVESLLADLLESAILSLTDTETLMGARSELTAVALTAENIMDRAHAKAAASRINDALLIRVEAA